MLIDETHDSSLRSWVESANDPATEFPIQNLPLCTFRHGGELQAGAAIGDRIFAVGAAARAGLLDVDPAIRFDSLAGLMAAGRDATRRLRTSLSRLLRADSTRRSDAEQFLLPASECELVMPVEIGDYTDFYASIHHATNVGSMFRPDNPLLPNYKWVPIGYHGRASSIVISGTPVTRPSGQTRDGEGPVQFGPSKRLDYEMELGVFVARGNAQGRPVDIADAREQMFGFVLVNDWSARDIQAWEYQPLGPFLAKNFSTTISPWVVTADALEPFRVAAFARSSDDPAPLPYLSSDEDQRNGGYDITLEVWIQSLQMREKGVAPVQLSSGNFRDMYWTVAQLITHHTSNGCNLRPGDLIASGTVSGVTKESRGSLLERAWRGTEPFELPTGEVRRFLEDGDEIIMRGWCEREGFRRIGFGECRGVVG